MTRWRVCWTRFERYEVEVYVTADSQEAAELAADELDSEETEGDYTDSERDNLTVEPLAADHEIRPYSYGAGPSRCTRCEEPVHFEQTPGLTTGTWLHTPQLEVEPQ